ncbi:MAG: prepilin peptidase [Candidatus Omnitrophica bacterium]|nr:prepilin peptidase [Candidatus Omnitrophota bacterium]
MENFIQGIVFLFGTIVGSFLNVCIVRLPHEQSVVHPRSHCTKCKKTIAWYDNIPLLSYLFLGGKCRHCKAVFSPRYLLVELLTGIAFLLFYLYFGPDKLLAPYLVMTSGFIVATFVDFEHRIIPDEVSVGGMCVGIILSLFIPEMHLTDINPSQAWYLTHLKSFGMSLFGVLIGGGSIYAMGMLGDFLFKKESMGGGDIKLLAMIGAFLGWKLAVLTFFIAPFFGAVFGIIEKIRTNDTAIPYGPFIVIAALISLFKGSEIIQWVLNGYGLY